MNNGVQTALLVLLSVGYAVLIILGIVLLIIVIKILSNIRRLTQRLDETTENMGEMAKYMGRKVAPAAVSALVSVFLRRAKSKIKRDK